MTHFDVAIIGLGAMGSCACLELARRGMSVVGFEQFEIPHTQGSYAGHTRAFRLAYYEHPDYVPLLKRAYMKWKQLERDAGESLFIETGGLYLGLPESPLIQGSLRSAAAHDLACDALDHDVLTSRYPQFKVPREFVGIFEPRAGILLSEHIVESACRLAARDGAAICSSEAVTHLDLADPARARIITDVRTVTAERVIVCAGAWTSRLLGEIGVPLRVSRQTLGWFTPPDTRGRELYASPTMPMWGWDDPDGIFRYGFPVLDGRPGLKISHHNPGSTIDPDAFARKTTAEDESELRASFDRVFGRCEATQSHAIQTCMYTNTPDEHFVIDEHPMSGNVIIAAGFSGHGFKFASVIGEALSDLAERGRTDLPIGFLSLARFR